MNEKIRDIHDRSKELVEKRQDLHRKREINRSDLQRVQEILKNDLKDDSDTGNIQKIENALVEDNSKIETDISENNSLKNEVLEEIDNYDQVLNNNLAKMDAMDQATDMRVDKSKEKRSSEKRINELARIRKMLDEGDSKSDNGNSSLDERDKHRAFVDKYKVNVKSITNATESTDEADDDSRQRERSYERAAKPAKLDDNAILQSQINSKTFDKTIQILYAPNDGADKEFDDSLEPNRNWPRDLPMTSYTYSIGPNGELTYDSPLEMDRYLYSSQGSAYKKFQGTCGLCSIANILRLAGVNASEKEIIDYAANKQYAKTVLGKKIPWGYKLCVVNPLDADASGGTCADDRQKILEHFGISSSIIPIEMDNGHASYETLEDIANYVADGRGVIISVCARILDPIFYRSNTKDALHAVTVTSVTRNRKGEVTGFYICDSNHGTSYYPSEVVQSALSGAPMNVTNTHIR